MGFGYWTERHIEAERKLNLRAAIEKAAGDAEKVKDTRAPAGAAPARYAALLQLRALRAARERRSSTPTRSSCAATISSACRAPTTPGAPPRLYGTGWPSNGGGRLVGSLSSLPYALAEAEQNFLIPTQTQALIWGDLVPQMILSAKIPRWWNVTPAQMHWVGLHLRYGRELLAEAALDRDAAHAGARRRSARWPRPRARGRWRACWNRATVRDAAGSRDAVGDVPRSRARWRAERDPQSSCLLAELKHMAADLARRRSTTPPSPAPSARPSRRWPIPTSRNC